MFHHILIPTDGSSLSSAALETGMRFTRKAEARVTLMTVIEPFHLFSLAADQVSNTPAESHEHAVAQGRRILSKAEPRPKCPVWTVRLSTWSMISSMRRSSLRHWSGAAT